MDGFSAIQYVTLTLHSFACFFFYVSYSGKVKLDGSRSYTLAHCLFAVSIFVYIFSDPVSALFLHVLAFGLNIFGYWFLLDGYRKFVNLPTGIRFTNIMPLLVVIAAVYLFSASSNASIIIIVTYMLMACYYKALVIQAIKREPAASVATKTILLGFKLAILLYVFCSLLALSQLGFQGAAEPMPSLVSTFFDFALFYNLLLLLPVSSSSCVLLALEKMNQSLEKSNQALAKKITQQESMLESMKYMALHDSLTGLPNRNLFFDRVDSLIAKSKRECRQFSLLNIDLRRFKMINDNYGHAAGDQYLIEVASRFCCIVRASDTVARLGGDEFAIILPDVNKDSIETALTKISGALELPTKINNDVVPLLANIGVAFYPEHGEDGDTLYNNADIAMYKAKNNEQEYSIYSLDIESDSVA